MGWPKGKPRAEETKKKIADSSKGRVKTPEERKHLSDARQALLATGWRPELPPKTAAHKKQIAVGVSLAWKRLSPEERAQRNAAISLGKLKKRKPHRAPQPCQCSPSCTKVVKRPDRSLYAQGHNPKSGCPPAKKAPLQPCWCDDPDCIELVKRPGSLFAPGHYPVEEIIQKREATLIHRYGKNWRAHRSARCKETIANLPYPRRHGVVSEDGKRRRIEAQKAYWRDPEHRAHRVAAIAAAASLAYEEGRCALPRYTKRTPPTLVHTVKGGDMWCRLSYEVAFAKIADAFPMVVELEYEPFRIPYFFEGRWHKYNPDFFLALEDGREFLVETKSPHMLKDPRELAKFAAARSYCARLGIKYVVIPEKISTRQELLWWLEQN